MNGEILPFFPGQLLRRSNRSAGMRGERPPGTHFRQLPYGVRAFHWNTGDFSTDKAAHACSDPQWRFYPLDEIVL